MVEKTGDVIEKRAVVVEKRVMWLVFKSPVFGLLNTRCGVAVESGRWW